jgi:hypothetical protein
VAVTIVPSHGGPSRQPWRLAGCLLLTLASATASLTADLPAARWGTLALIPISGWFGFDFARTSSRVRSKQAVRARLMRLPNDFYLLHDLVIPAPWGETRCDAIVISRFGVIVVGAGPRSAWVPGQVEAVRSVLFTHGLTQPPVPVGGLVMLPPGATVGACRPLDVPVVGVDQLQLRHLTPGGKTVLTDEQVGTIAQCLLQARAAC